MQSSPLFSDSGGCRTCAVRRNCLSAQLDATVLSGFQQIVSGHPRLARHQKFLASGMPFKHVYILRSGQCKAEHEAPDGTRKVVEFYGPGQMVGLEGLGAGSHCFDAIALCDSEVCEIPYADLVALMAGQAPLLVQFHALLGMQLRHLQQAQLMGGATAQRRIAAFLLDLSHQHAALGETGDVFSLRMSREEIGSYLGLAVESISRMLTRFRAEGLINVSNRKIVLRDTAGLRRLTGNPQSCQPEQSESSP